LITNTTEVYGFNNKILNTLGNPVNASGNVKQRCCPLLTPALVDVNVFPVITNPAPLPGVADFVASVNVAPAVEELVSIVIEPCEVFRALPDKLPIKVVAVIELSAGLHDIPEVLQIGLIPSVELSLKLR